MSDANFDVFREAFEEARGFYSVQPSDLDRHIIDVVADLVEYLNKKVPDMKCVIAKSWESQYGHAFKLSMTYNRLLFDLEVGAEIDQNVMGDDPQPIDSSVTFSIGIDNGDRSNVLLDRESDMYDTALLIMGLLGESSAGLERGEMLQEARLERTEPQPARVIFPKL